MSTLNAKQVIVRSTIIIAIAELLVILLLDSYEYKSGIYTKGILAIVLLVILSMPAIYLWVIKPFIKARENVLDQVSHLALNDPLTQVANRKQLIQFLHMNISSCKRHNHFGALLLVDLNHFKSVNESYGHEAGDAVLIEVASRLNKVVRTEDLVGRLGGDEFLIILSRLGNDRASAINELGHIAQRIVFSLREPVVFEENKLDITASFGIPLIEPDSTDFETIMKQADAAMLMSKQQDREFAVTIYQD